MWSLRTETLHAQQGVRCTVKFQERDASVTEVLAAWRNDPAFATQFSDWLARAPYAAYRWETPAADAGTLSKTFEFVLLDSPRLARPPEPEAFAEQFAKATDTIVAFANLGRDATLVVPCPIADADAYGHLAAFVRTAPAEQQQQLWKFVAIAMEQRIGAKPVWLSTAGAGVSWLHVRLDNRPKYYAYLPYTMLR